jgi:hypothetical protein
MNLNPISAIVETVGNVIGDLHTSDKERLDAEIELRRIDASLMQGQMEVNKVEAASASLFVAGWRPAIGWIGAAAMAYQFLLYPLLVWGWSLMQARGWVPSALTPPPMLDTDALWVVLTGMLGIAGARTLEKVKGVAR